MGRQLQGVAGRLLGVVGRLQGVAGRHQLVEVGNQAGEGAGNQGTLCRDVTPWDNVMISLCRGKLGHALLLCY